MWSPSKSSKSRARKFIHKQQWLNQRLALGEWPERRQAAHSRVGQTGRRKWKHVAVLSTAELVYVKSFLAWHSLLHGYACTALQFAVRTAAPAEAQTSTRSHLAGPQPTQLRQEVLLPWWRWRLARSGSRRRASGHLTTLPRTTTTRARRHTPIECKSEGVAHQGYQHHPSTGAQT